MNIRKLQLKDAFKVGKIIKHGSLKNVVADGYETLMKDGADQEYLGINLFFDIVYGVSDDKVEKEIYELIEDIAGIEDASSMEFEDMTIFVKTLVKENNLANFTKLVKKFTT